MSEPVEPAPPLPDLGSMIVRVRAAIAKANVAAVGAAVDEAMAAYRDHGDVKIKLLAVYGVAAASAINQDEPTIVLDTLDSNIARLAVIAAS